MTAKTSLISSGVALLLCIPGVCLAGLQLDLLREIVAAYNAEWHASSLVEGTYRGEEGDLRIRPDIARSLGLKVPEYPDYLSAMALYGEAERALEKAETALAVRTPETFPHQHAHEAAVHALRARSGQETGWKQLMSYRMALSSDEDERLNPHACSDLMDKLILKSLEENGFNLREALAFFFNLCQGVSVREAPITQENVRFVNGVFKAFTDRASASSLARLDLDRMDRRRPADPDLLWQCLADGEGIRYVNCLKEIIADEYNSTPPVDPLLFLALVRRESGFDPRAVSSVGAVGLTQIMPQTALDMGMGSVLVPSYLEEARRHLVLERRLKHQAITLIRQIQEDTALSQAKRARGLMQDSLEQGRRRAELYARYRSELLRTGNDDRLQAKKALAFGLKYFVAMMRMHEGDMSLALAGYNAGPHRVRQYQGIPPFGETVTFRNAVLAYYREYLKRVNDDACRR